MEIGGVRHQRFLFLKVDRFTTDLTPDFTTDNYQACLIKSVENQFFGRF